MWKNVFLFQKSRIQEGVTSKCAFMLVIQLRGADQTSNHAAEKGYFSKIINSFDGFNEMATSSFKRHDDKWEDERNDEDSSVEVL